MPKIVGQLKAILGLDKKKFDQGLKSAKKQGSKFGSAMKKIGGILAAAFAVHKIVQWAKALKKAYQVQKEAEVKLATVIKQRMGLGKKAVDDLKKQASAYQKIGIIGDEVQLSGLQQLATFLKQKKSLENLLPAMNNLLAQQRGFNANAQDAVNIANLMGKVLDGQVSSLKRVGISFTEAQAEALKHGNELERSAILSEVITNNVGAMNEELARTNLGKIQTWNNLWGDFKEMLGEKIVPALAKVAEWGSRLIKNINKQSESLRKQQIELNSLVTVATSATISEEARLQVIEDIQKIYPDFIGNIDAEKVSNEQLKKALEETNLQMKERIRLAILQEALSAEEAKLTKQIAREINQESELAAVRAQIAREEEIRNKDRVTETEASIRYMRSLYEREEALENALGRTREKQDAWTSAIERTNTAIREQLKILDEIEKTIIAPTPTAAAGGVIGPAKPTFKGQALIPVIPEAAIEGLGIAKVKIEEMNRTMAESIAKTFELAQAESTLGNITTDIFGGMANAISDAMGETENVLQAFWKFFTDFIKGMIIKLVAATIAALALAVILSALGLGGGIAARGAKAATEFGKLFLGGFKTITGMQGGGVVPGGYPNDTFPAMLSSGETVLTPDQLDRFGRGRLDVRFEGELGLRGEDLYWTIEEIKRKRRDNF